MAEFTEKLGQAMIDNAQLNFYPDSKNSKGDFGESTPEAYTSEHYNFDQQWLLALGSFMCAYTGDYVNAFESTGNESYVKMNLEDAWDIVDANSFRETAQSLITAGHRTQFQPHMQLIASYRETLDNAGGLMKFAVNVIPNAALPYFQKKHSMDFRQVAPALGLELTELARMLEIGYGKATMEHDELLRDMPSVDNILAWDAVRVVNISRLAMLAGYISQEEAEQYASQLKAQVQDTYDSWRSVGVAYALGAIIWHPSQTRAEAMNRTVSMLLDDPRALVNKISFK
ncbi:hypothetical protein KIM372_04410 [Bombiscardovia nodaiensis]|uniref:DUF1266 domain-containing protein n=1 Tax=Bombiscardovia nodaiensis TaxID=2932181 RepID=A0ABN6S8K4_9BIFI|nr:hypothetical protein KIM372_04410 [Bombiscardovia nodaiensis]